MTNIAATYTKEGIAHRRRQEAPCPRCMEPCGWCSDPRWMHGTVNLPGTRRKCTIAGLEPEGADCPVCHGALRVVATTTYAALSQQGGLG